MVLSTWYMDIKYLLDLVCYKIALKTKNKESQDIIQKLKEKQSNLEWKTWDINFIMDKITKFMKSFK